MDYIIGLVLGVLVMLVLFKKPLEITIHHTYKNEIEPISDSKLAELEQEMLKEDPKMDNQYMDLGEFLVETRNVMEGSDR